MVQYQQQTKAAARTGCTGQACIASLPEYYS